MPAASTRRIAVVSFLVCFVTEMTHTTAKVSEEVNRNTTVQLTSAPTRSAAMHSVTDRPTDRQHYDAKGAVRSAKKSMKNPHMGIFDKINDESTKRL